MMNWDYTMYGWMAGWMWILMILVVAILVIGTVSVARNTSGGRR